MSSKEKVYKSQTSSLIDDFVRRKRSEKAAASGKDEGDVKFLNVLEFIDTFQILPFGLYPVQKFILKVYYNIPLDDKEKTIKITDRFGREVKHEFTEKEYLRFLYDQGRCNIKEQDGKSRNELILVCGRRSGKCSDLNTIVPTSGGMLTLNEILNISGSKREIGWTNFSTKITKEFGSQSSVDAVYYGGVQKTRRIRTYCGYSQNSTPEHRLKVLDDRGEIVWKYFKDLSVGDLVGIDRTSNLWSSNYVQTPFHDHPRENLPKFVDENLGEFLGILAGDGTWPSKTGLVQVTGGCEELLSYLVPVYDRYFGRHKIHRVVRDRTTCEVAPWCIQINSKKARSWLDSIGFRLDATTSTKSVPWVIFKSPKTVVASFLRGLFESDGGMEKRNTISFSSHSEQLCKDVQLLLINFGIVSRYTKKYNRKFDIYNYILNILGGKSRKIFFDEIGFITKRKNLILENNLKTITDGCSDTESIPNLKGILRLLRESIPTSFHNRKGVTDKPRTLFRDIAGNVLKKSSEENISYDRLQKSINFARAHGADRKICDQLQELVDKNYFWDPITSIEETESEVADISVPDGNQYVANGILNHNSEISSIIAGYETFKLLVRGNPQSYYGMPSGSDIRLLCVANDKEQASIVFGNMQGHIEKVDYFKSAFANSTQQFLRFRTEEDKRIFGNSSNKASITVTFKSSVAKGLRGRAVICAIMDEIAFFVDDGMTSADKVYSAINPSLAQFSPKDPKNKHKSIGNTEGRMILISSPSSKDGFFYKQYVKAMSAERGSEGMLVIQAPTWEVNPTLSPEYYEREYFKDPRVFTTEHGAEFSDRTRGWIEDARDLESCINADLKPKLHSLPREPHFLGLDFGISNDGTAIALTRLANKKIELAYHEVWYPKKPWDLSNPHLEVPWVEYARGLSNEQRLDIDAIGEWLLAISKKFFIYEGVFDQWAGPVMEQIVHKIGLTQIKTRNFSVSDSSRMYSIFKSLMFNKAISLYDYPRPESTLDGMQGKHSPLITELLELQANSGGKNITIVEAPAISGKHDDVSDALARSVLLASEYIMKYPDALEASGYTSNISQQRQIGSYTSYQRQRARNHGVVSERSLPRMNKFRLGR